MADLADLPGTQYGLAQYLAAKRAFQDQDQKDQFLQQREALGPNATVEQYGNLGLRFSDPRFMAQVGESTADRKAAIAQRADAVNQLYNFKIQNMDQQMEATLRRIQNEEHRTELKNVIEQQKNELTKQRNDIMLQLGLTRAEVDRMRVGQTQNKPPSGFRFTPEGNLEAIPGGPADTKLQGQLNQDTAQLQSAEAGLNRLELEATRLKSHPGLSKSTGAMSVVPGVGGLATIPGTDAANFKAGLESLKSQTGLSVLQDLRNASKTGGALGQVSDFENRMLQANLGSLDRAQSQSEFEASLDKIITHAQEARGRLRNAYNMKHSGKSKGGWSIQKLP